MRGVARRHTHTHAHTRTHLIALVDTCAAEHGAALVDPGVELLEGQEVEGAAPRRPLAQEELVAVLLARAGESRCV
jgi:hypothetical protein